MITQEAYDCWSDSDDTNVNKTRDKPMVEVQTCRNLALSIPELTDLIDKPDELNDI